MSLPRDYAYPFVLYMAIVVNHQGTPPPPSDIRKWHACALDFHMNLYRRRYYILIPAYWRRSRLQHLQIFDTNPEGYIECLSIWSDLPEKELSTKCLELGQILDGYRNMAVSQVRFHSIRIVRVTRLRNNSQLFPFVRSLGSLTLEFQDVYPG